MFLHPNWPAPSTIQAVTTLRTSPGQSLAPYDQCNMATHVGDDHNTVQTNRLLVQQALHLTSEPIWLNQTHGTRCVLASTENTGCDADASYTQNTNTVCAILTADCLPILLCNKTGSTVAAIHAGWRGLCHGIITRTLMSINQPYSDFMAWLGPAIGPSHYTVGDEVRNSFISQDSTCEEAFIPISPGQWLCNLYLLAHRELARLGITEIFGGDYCTFAESDRFFSYRRDHGHTGRMATLIWINDSRS